jgi:hypothetical protein
MIKAFDWDESNRSPQMKAFLQSVQHSGMSESAFVDAYRQIPYNGTRGQNKARGPSRARNDYKRLVKIFDFFSPDKWSITTPSSSRPAANHKDIMKKLSEGKELAPDDLAKLSKVKAKIEIVGDYEDMEKVKDVLKGLSKKND